MPLDGLSPREREVFRLQTHGLSSKQIASQLFISHKTVQTHRTRIFRKLRVHSAAELVRFAAVHGLIAP
jgi:two-component system response regulator NreC